MEVWRSITTTLRCLWCVSNPESPLDQTSPAVSSPQAKVDTGTVTSPAQEVTSSAAATGGPSPDHSSQAAIAPPSSPPLPPVRITTTQPDTATAQTPSVPPLAQPVTDHPLQTQSSAAVPCGENEQETPATGTSSPSIANADTEASLAQSPQPPGASSASPVPEKPALGASVVEPPNPVAEGHRSPTTTPQGWSDFKKTAKGALLSILKIAKEASTPLPPLQAVLGGVVASVEIYNVSVRRSQVGSAT